jgi:DNA mismatch endonuclease, patch repair protein
MDNLTTEQRSRNMSAIRSRDTMPERAMYAALKKIGYRAKRNVRALSGTPDIVVESHSTVIFVNGCFWHRHAGCSRSVSPKTNRGYWLPKLAKNVRADRTNYRKLRSEGWHVVVVWECQIRGKFHTALTRVEHFLARCEIKAKQTTRKVRSL